MSLATLVRRPACIPGDDGSAIRVRDARASRSLDDLLTETVAGLVTHRTVACPVCRGHLRPRYGASGQAPLGGRCDDCDSTLA